MGTSEHIYLLLASDAKRASLRRWIIASVVVIGLALLAPVDAVGFKKPGAQLTGRDGGTQRGALYEGRWVYKTGFDECVIQEMIGRIAKRKPMRTRRRAMAIEVSAPSRPVDYTLQSYTRVVSSRHGQGYGAGRVRNLKARVATVKGSSGSAGGFRLRFRIPREAKMLALLAEWRPDEACAGPVQYGFWSFFVRIRRWR